MSVTGLICECVWFEINEKSNFQIPELNKLITNLNKSKNLAIVHLTIYRLCLNDDCYCFGYLLMIIKRWNGIRGMKIRNRNLKMMRNNKVIIKFYLKRSREAKREKNDSKWIVIRCSVMTFHQIKTKHKHKCQFFLNMRFKRTSILLSEHLAVRDMKTNERMRNKQQQNHCINCEQDKHSNVFNKCSVIVIKITLEFSTENYSWNENQIEKQNQMKNHG